MFPTSKFRYFEKVPFTNLSNSIFAIKWLELVTLVQERELPWGSILLHCHAAWTDWMVGAPSCIGDIVNRIVLFTTLFGQRVQKWRTVEKHAHKKGVQCGPNFSVSLPSFMQITSLHNNSIQCSNFFSAGILYSF